jgi:tetratricopeptide (TPR) repeat protein
MQSDTSAIYFALAKTYKALERYPEAIASARKAAELSGEDDPLADDVKSLLQELEQAGD